MTSTEMESVLSQLSPETRKRIQLANAINLERLEVPSIGLNTELKGGIGYGRQTLIWGSKSAGKSTFCLKMIAKAQKEGKLCAWVDAEGSYDPVWAAKLGVDEDNLIVSQVKTINDMTAVVTSLMRAGVDVVVVDSISALLSSAFFEKDSEDLKEVDKTKQIGSEARDMAQAVKQLNYANEKTALILISQVRNKIETYGAVPTATGGQAVAFFSTTVIKLWSSPAAKNQIQGHVFVGDKILERPIGRPVNWEIVNNKIGPQSATGEYNLYYAGDFIGIDNVDEIVSIAVERGVIEKGGAWFTVEDQRFQGKPKVVQFVKENPDVYESLKRRINGEV